MSDRLKRALVIIVLNSPRQPISKAIDALEEAQRLAEDAALVIGALLVIAHGWVRLGGHSIPGTRKT